MSASEPIADLFADLEERVEGLTISALACDVDTDEVLFAHGADTVLDTASALGGTSRALPKVSPRVAQSDSKYCIAKSRAFGVSVNSYLPTSRSKIRPMSSGL